ncbi:MAG: tetratricopeptide (TPR) repeat protein [Candidatus Promineifilaceae bacterium]|jgi:tetratricopeptide (TPR) repeat protein
MKAKGRSFQSIRHHGLGFMFVCVAAFVMGCGRGAPTLQEQFEQSVSNEPNGQEAAGLFYACLSEHISNDRIDEAQAFYAQHIEASPMLAETGYTAIVEYFISTNRPNTAAVWSESILAYAIPENLRLKVFSDHLDALTRAGDVAQAQALLLEGLQSKDSAALIAFGTITRRLQALENSEELLRWTMLLADNEAIDSAMRSRALVWHVHALLGGEEAEQIVALIPKGVAMIPERDFEALFDSVFRSWSQGKAFDRVGLGLSALASAITADSELQDFLAFQTVALAIARGVWADAAATFRNNTDALDDRSQRALFGRLVAGASSQSAWDVLDGFSQHVLENMSSNASLRDAAAVTWMDCAQKRVMIDVLPQRIRRIFDAKVSTHTLLNTYSTALYTSMSGEHPVILGELLAIGDDFAPTVTEDSDKKTLASLRFDAAFVLEDYDRVLVALDAGLPDKDEAWHAMARNKVLAHKALKEGDHAQAVKRFRGFLEHVDKTWVKPEYDPSTGVRHSREMALGFNAKRIADIQQKAGDVAGALVTYRESMAYYTDALGKTETQPKAHTLVTTAIKEIEDILASDGT